MMGAAGAARAQNADPGQTREKLFQQIFGTKPPPHEQRLSVPVMLDEREIAQVPLQISGDFKEASIDAASLLDALRPLLTPETLSALDQRKTEQATLTLGDLRAVGVEARIDQASVTLALSIPFALRARQSIDLRNPAPRVGPNGALAPATLSSILNIRGALDYVHEAAPGTRLGLQPLNLALESATGVYGNVLQGDVNYVEGSDHPFQRGDVSVIHDDPDNAVRYQAGDLAYPVTGFQAFQPLSGITVARNFALQPYRTVQPSGLQEVTLTANSRVEVLVNGQRTQVLQLAAGRYDLRNFPFTQGANDVQLRITDPSGRVNVINLPFIFSTDLLAEGISQFSYSVGLPSATINGSRSYAIRTPSLSLFHRLGVTDALTIGANFQGDNLQQLAGGEISVATVAGNFRLDSAGSRIGGGGDGVATRLQYNFIASQGVNVVNRAFQAAATYTSAGFAPLGTTVPANPIKLDLNAGYFQTLPLDTSGGVAVSRQFGRGRPNTSLVDLSLRRFWSHRISTSIDLSHTVDPAGRGSYRALLTLTFQSADNRHFVTSSYDTLQNASQVSWQYVPASDVGIPAANVSLANGNSQRIVNAESTYNTSRVETDFTHDETFPIGGAAPDRRSVLNFGSALLFADGHYAVGRPTTDSFALVVPHPNLAGLTVGVDPIVTADQAAADHYLAQADWFGPGVLVNLTSYQVQTATVTVPNLPVGYDLGGDQFQVLPSFRSGTVIAVGTGAQVILDAIVQDEEGKPLYLVGGHAAPAAESGGKTAEFFTNRTGRIRIDGLRPGTYVLTFPSLPQARVSVTIPPNTTGIYRIGTLRITSSHAE